MSTHYKEQHMTAPTKDQIKKALASLAKMKPPHGKQQQQQVEDPIYKHNPNFDPSQYPKI